MKVSLLIIGVILFFIGTYTKMNFFIAAGMILIIMSFFGGVIRKKEKKEEPLRKGIIKTKMLCPSCRAELFEEDNYCPECGKKVLP